LKSDDDEVKKVKFFPIQDKAPTKLDAASTPGNFPEPTYHLTSILIFTLPDVRISNFLSPLIR
jgi:hypothetical protein